MKRIIRHLTSWLGRLPNQLIILFFFLALLLVIREPLNYKYSNSIFPDFIDTIITLSLFGFGTMWGLIIIKNREAPVFIIPIKGIFAVILGWFLTISGSIIIIWYIIARLVKK
jgi:hypothetical protein